MSEIPSPATTDELAAHVSALRADLAALQAYISFLPRTGDVDFKSVFRLAVRLAGPGLPSVEAAPLMIQRVQIAVENLRRSSDLNPTITGKARSGPRDVADKKKKPPSPLRIGEQI